MDKKRSTDLWLCRSRRSFLGASGYQLVGGKDLPTMPVDSDYWVSNHNTYLMFLCAQLFSKFLPKSLKLKVGKGPKRIRITIEEI